MSAICDGLYVRPVETFWEALQYVVLTIAIMSIESNGVSVAPGRVDQYLYPYYQRDLEAGAADARSGRRALHVVPDQRQPLLTSCAPGKSSAGRPATRAALATPPWAGKSRMAATPATS